MSLTSAELRKLAALKLSPAQMAGVLELMALRAEREEEALRAEQDRRLADAARKREKRAAQKSANVHGQSVDSPQIVRGHSEDCPVNVQSVSVDMQRTPSPPSSPPFPLHPLSPPISPPSRPGLGFARDPDADLEARLREAAGWQSHPNPKLAVTGPIVALLEAGADLEMDVLPVISALAPKVRTPSWAYFVNPIAEARDNRINAATVVSLPTSSARSHSHAAHRKPSRDETFAAIDRRIDELREAERRATGGGAGHPEDPAEGAA